jgi:hypothetical protein
MKHNWKDEPTPFDDLPEINSYDEIPAFDNEDEEHEFWSTHALGPGLLETMGRATVTERLREIGFKGPLPESPKKRLIAKKKR